MDYIEEIIYKELDIKAYKTLKDEFYKPNMSPQSHFYAEYQNQYHQYTALLKLYIAFSHLQYFQNTSQLIQKRTNNIFNTINLFNNFLHYTDEFEHINSFIKNIFSVCDILANQIYIILSNDVKGISKIYLHKFKTDINDINNTVAKDNFCDYKKSKKLFDKINMNWFNNYFKTIVCPVLLENSWYDDLKYYRNGITHGLLRLTYHDFSRNTYLLKRDIYENEKEFEFVVRNMPVHNLNPTPDTQIKLRAKFNYVPISAQFRNYYENVKKLTSDVWQKMSELYSNESKEVNWKLK